MIDIKAIKAAADRVKGWSNCDKAWLDTSEDESAAMFGAICEEGVRYPVATVDCDQYMLGEDSLPLAKFYATANPATVIALCDEIERLQQQVTIYEKHGVTCQTFGHKLTGCAECNRDDAADDAMALDTLKLQARQYFELLPEIERLRKDAAAYHAIMSEPDGQMRAKP